MSTQTTSNGGVPASPLSPDGIAALSLTMAQRRTRALNHAPTRDELTRAARLRDGVNYDLTPQLDASGKLMNAERLAPEVAAQYGYRAPQPPALSPREQGRLDARQAQEYLNGQSEVGGVGFDGAVRATSRQAGRAAIGAAAVSLSPGARALVAAQLAGEEDARRTALRADPVGDNIKAIRQQLAANHPLVARYENDLKTFLASDGSDIFERDPSDLKKFKRTSDGNFVPSSRFGTELMDKRKRAAEGDKTAKQEVAALEAEYRTKLGRYQAISKPLEDLNARNREAEKNLAGAIYGNTVDTNAIQTPAKTGASFDNPGAVFEAARAGGMIESSKTQHLLDSRPNVAPNYPHGGQGYQPKDFAGIQKQLDANRTPAPSFSNPRRPDFTAAEKAAGASVSYDPQPGIPAGHGVIGGPGKFFISAPDGVVKGEDGQKRQFASMDEVTDYLAARTKPQGAPSPAPATRPLAPVAARPPSPAPAAAVAQPAAPAQDGYGATYDKYGLAGVGEKAFVDASRGIAAAGKYVGGTIVPETVKIVAGNNALNSLREIAAYGAPKFTAENQARALRGPNGMLPDASFSNPGPARIRTTLPDVSELNPQNNAPAVPPSNDPLLQPHKNPIARSPFSLPSASAQFAQPSGANMLTQPAETVDEYQKKRRANANKFGPTSMSSRPIQAAAERYNPFSASQRSMAYAV